MEFNFSKLGAALKNINLDFSNLTQVEGSTTAIINPDGNTEGKLESYNIGSLGEINGVYSNGEIVTLGKLAIANVEPSPTWVAFLPPRLSDKILSETPESGTGQHQVFTDQCLLQRRKQEAYNRFSQ